MVTLSEKVVSRFASDALMARIEMTLKELDAPKFVKRLDLLSDLLDRLSQQTKMSNPGISQEARALSRSIYNSKAHLDTEGRDTLDEVRNLLSEVLF